MKTVQKLILVTGLLLAPFALLAKSPEQVYVESYRGRTDLPAPTSVVKPSVPAEFAGRTVVLEFVVDAAGIPRDISVKGDDPIPTRLLTPVVDAVARWKFTPLRRAGVAVASKVILPLRIMDEFDARGVLASK